MMNTKTMEQFEVMNSEMLAGVEGGWGGWGEAMPVYQEALLLHQHQIN